MDNTQVVNKSSGAFRTIGEVSMELNLSPHVLRFWESNFNQIKPQKRRGGHRYYRPEDIEAIREVRYLLYDRGFTIKGAKNYLKNKKDSVALIVAGNKPVAENKTENKEQSKEQNKNVAAAVSVNINDNINYFAHHDENKGGIYPGSLKRIIEELSEIREFLRESA